jgi:sarcosine oxidase, subunit delta
MKTFLCPVNGPRPISEFAYWGEVRSTPAHDHCSDKQWADYVFNRNGASGIKKEWWCHTPSNVWFIAERDTAIDKVLRTYLPVDGVDG